MVIRWELSKGTNLATDTTAWNAAMRNLGATAEEAGFEGPSEEDTSGDDNTEITEEGKARRLWLLNELLKVIGHIPAEAGDGLM